MKRAMIAALIGIAGSTVAFAQKGGSAQPAMKGSVDSVSYAIGINIGRSVVKDSVQINVEMLKAGILDAMKGPDKQRFTDSAAQMILSRLQQTVMDRAQNRLALQNKERGEAFLKENKMKPGVRTTASGLQYIVLSEGSGDSPSGSDEVTVNYRGTLVDGTEFDKTEPGKPVDFPADAVIAGWVEALEMMKPGARWKLFIPSELAYGESGAPGGAIGPNETLIFDVELVSVKKN